jgi:hypothetical protein
MCERFGAFRARFRLVLTLSGWMLLTGCGTTAAPAPVSEDLAKQALERALSSWQKGETTEAMKNASPSMVVSEEKWRRGDKLTKFELEGASKPSGSERVIRATLWLTDSKGKETKEAAEYRVGDGPVQTVFRVMFR